MSNAIGFMIVNVVIAWTIQWGSPVQVGVKVGMFESCCPIERLRAYERLSMWEKKVLCDWIGERVGDMLLWSYTSIGLLEFFEESEFGFAISHAQLQQAMLLAGHQPMDADAEAWLFATGETMA